MVILPKKGAFYEKVKIYREPNTRYTKEGKRCCSSSRSFREHGISNATFYNWRTKYGGMNASLMGRMKELEEENRRL